MPLTDNLRRSILPEGHVSSDTRKLLLYFRLDHTGRLLSELPHQRPPSRVWDHLSAALDARAPIRGVLPYVGRSRDISSIYHIVLPLADDGETVDRLLVCVDLGPLVRLEDGTHPFTQLGTSLG